jgi:hypothetical protein
MLYAAPMARHPEHTPRLIVSYHFLLIVGIVAVFNHNNKFKEVFVVVVVFRFVSRSKNPFWSITMLTHF